MTTDFPVVPDGGILTLAAPDADPERVRAVRIGGRITCSSALRQHGIWVIPDDRLHVAVHGNASRLRSPEDRRKPWHVRPGVCLHWSDSSIDQTPGASIDTVPAAIAELIGCADRITALVSIDSALNGAAAGRPMLTRKQLREVLSRLPAKYAELETLADARSRSGLETLARLRLRSRGLRARTQVQIPLVGRIDVLIGDRLVLELDSRSHHLGSGYETDRRRDLELFRQGYVVLRVSYRRVMYDWQSVEDVILIAVRRGDHLWRAMHNRLGLATIP